MAVKITLTGSVFGCCILLFSIILVAQSKDEDFKYYVCPKFEPFFNFSLDWILNQKLLYNVAFLNPESTSDIVYNCSFIRFFKCGEEFDDNGELLPPRYTAVVTKGKGSFSHRFIFPEGEYFGRGGFVRHPIATKNETYIAEVTWLDAGDNYQVFVVCNPRTRIGVPSIKVYLAHAEGKIITENLKTELIDFIKIFHPEFENLVPYELEHTRCKYNIKTPETCDTFHCWSTSFRTKRCKPRKKN